MKIKTFQKIRRNINTAVDLAASRARFMVDGHARNGEFSGGDLANQGYSETTIPAYFLGSLDVVLGGIKATNYFTSAILPDEDIKWRWSKKGRITPYYTKGYKGFRQQTGRQTASVDLTFSGQMLRNLSARVRPQGRSFVVDVYVKAPFNERMTYTNNRRKWLYLSNSEVRTISSDFRRNLLN